MQDNGKETRITISAQQARQGRIVLDTKAKRAAFLGAVAATGVLGVIAVFVAVR